MSPTPLMNLTKAKALLVHMEQGSRLDRFDFGSVYHVCNDRLGKTCHTCGCMLGEFPRVWPEMFQYGTGTGYDQEIHYRDVPERGHYREWFANWDKHTTRQSCLLAVHWLECQLQDSRWLFFPEEKHQVLGPNGLTIYSDITQVTNGLRRMIYFKETGKTKPEPSV